MVWQRAPKAMASRQNVQKQPWLFGPPAGGGLFQWIKNPYGCPKRHRFRDSVFCSIFQKTPVSINSLIHKHYFHMLSLAHARLIYYLL